MKYPPIHYHDYLQLDKLLTAQKRRSEEFGAPAHDEMLFISVHQAYEIWFKQILFDLASVQKIFAQTPMPERDLGTAVRRLERVHGILKHSLGQIDILETMTPLDFLDFRDFLYPASGFQSAQFRLLETRLGLRNQDRLSYNQTPFQSHLPEAQRKEVEQALTEPSLFDLVQGWLERTPFLQARDYHFWSSYQTAVMDLLAADRKTVEGNSHMGEDAKKRNLMMIEMTENTFKSLFDAKAYEELRQGGKFRLSAKALHAALFIQVYRDEPLLQQPYRLISALLDLDEVLTQWRARHTQMVLRMLGRKIGTGGSSGHDYLKETTDRHKVFSDFFSLASFLIPRSKVPPLPTELRQRLDFAP